MTDQEIIDYYATALIIQYRKKPKAFATIQTLVEPVVMNQLPMAVQNGFNLDTAIGVQLDVLGKYTGVTRNGYGTSGPITLNDIEFRQLIRMAIVTNNSGSSLADIQNLLHQFFPNQIFVFDNKTMRLSYLIDSDLGSIYLVQMFINQGLLPKPMAVGISVDYLTEIDNIFSYVTYENPVLNNQHGYNTYEQYDLDAPWITYEDSVVF